MMPNPQSFRSSPDQTAKRVHGRNPLTYARIVGGSSAHFNANFWRLHEIDFIEGSRWSGRGRQPGRLADHLCRTGALLHQGGMGSGRFEPGRASPFDPVALQALSHAAAAGKILGAV
jgi:choline dehydrogenase-like flavoprotein